MSDALGNRKKKRKRLWIILIILALLAIALVAANNAIRSRLPGLRGGAQAQSASAQRRTLTKSVVGTGSLSHSRTIDIELADTAILDGVLVEAGQRVAQGQQLATLDHAALEEAIAAAQSSLKQLDAALSRLTGASTTATVSAPVAGRVKLVYAAAGDDAADVCQEHGALVVLSTDGYLKATVAYADEGVSIGQKARVTLADGSAVEGTVSDISAGSVTVLIGDDGPAAGEHVTIASADGSTPYGSAALQISAPLPILAPEGRVRSISVAENRRVSKGATLLTLEELGFGSEYFSQLGARNEQAQALNDLLAIKRAGGVFASVEGIVTQVPQSAQSASAAQGAQGTQSAQSASSAAFVIAYGGATKLSISIDELDIGVLSVGQKAVVTLDALEGKSFDGALEHISNLGTASGGIASFPAVIELEPDDLLLSGMNATATIVIEQRRDVLTIPLDALQEEPGAQYVYVDAAMTARRAVKTGLSDGAYVEVLEGLAEGEAVYYTVAGQTPMDAIFGPGAMPGRGNQRPAEPGGR